MPGAQGATDSGARASVPYDTQLKKRKHIVPQSPAGNEGQGFAGFKACAGAAQKATCSVFLVPRRSVTRRQQQTHHDDNVDTSDSSATIRDLFGSWMNFQCSCFACCRTNHIQPSAHAYSKQSVAPQNLHAKPSQSRTSDGTQGLDCGPIGTIMQVSTPSPFCQSS